MTITLPTGWTTFTGGGTIPALCGEPQDCPEPPCGEIPPLVITPPAGGHVPINLSCTPDGFSITLDIVGGVAPFIWASSGGSVTVGETGRTATVDIGNNNYLGDFDEKVGSIAFFKPHMFTRAMLITSPDQHCINLAGGSDVYYRDATVDTRLRAYDCLKRHITDLNDSGDQFLDNIQVDDTNDRVELDNPIGDDSGDRGAVLSVDWPYTDPDTPSHAASDPDHWSVSTTGCGPNDTGNASVHITATLAGKNGIHGAIHADSPSYDKTMNIVIDPLPVAEVPNVPIRDTDFPAGFYLDVRTQVQVDTECCVVPSGSDVIVTVIDAQGVVAVIVIPVVEPI